MQAARQFNPVHARWCSTGRLVSDRYKLFRMAGVPYQPPCSDCAYFSVLDIERQLGISGFLDETDTPADDRTRLFFATRRHNYDMMQSKDLPRVLAIMQYPEVPACALQLMLEKLAAYEPDIIDLIWANFVAMG